jgi:hypothetical protein
VGLFPVAEAVPAWYSRVAQAKSNGKIDIMQRQNPGRRGPVMLSLNEAIRLLGEERVAEIRACAGELLRQVLADRERFSGRLRQANPAEAVVRAA